MQLEYRQLDLQTFIADSKRLRLWLLFVGAVPLILLGLPVLIALPFHDRVRPFLSSMQQSGDDIWIQVGFGVWVAVVLGAMALLQRRVYLDPRVRCPSCGKSLLQHSAVVIATGKCGHCGSQVLSPESLPTPVMPKQTEPQR